MIDLQREEDKKAVVGTVTFYALILLFIFILALFSCGEEEDDLAPSGGVTISVGEPDQGGSDNSAAEQVEEEYTPPVEEEYTPEHQITSDVDEAPAVQKTEPTTKPKPKVNKPVDKPKETVKPKETKPVERKPNQKSMFPGKDKTGNGKGNPSDKGGYTGSKDGKPGGSPDGTGGKGSAGSGTGDGPSIGPGITGGIGGFSIAAVSQPKGGVQEKGVVRLKVCVDTNGNVIPSSIKYAPDRNPETTTNLTLRNNAIAALKKFKFSNNSGSNGGCGYINFTFKLN